MKLTIRLLPHRLSICRLAADAAIPSTLLQAHAGFLSITRTADELSIVCPEALVPKDAKAEHGWRAFQVQGPLDFSLTGIIAALTAPLSEAKISVFTVATFDTDYLLVREKDLEGAISALEKISRVQR